MILNVNAACEAVIKKQIFEIKPQQKDGLILTINHTFQNKTNLQKIRFLQASFNKAGTSILAITQRGDVFIINFESKKFWKVQTVNCCSVLRFSPITDSELLVGIFSGPLYVINADSGDATALLAGHLYPVTDLSFSNNNLCISASNCEGIIWNLNNNEKVQVLQLADETILKQVMFMPGSNNILACFQDDIINIWKYDTYEHFKQILPTDWNKISIKSIAFTKNGKAMVLGGYSQNLYVFIIELWEVVRTITLPDHIQGVKKLEFIAQPLDEGANKFLAILSSNGSVYFYNMETDGISQKLNMDLEVVRFCAGADCKRFACVQSSGDLLVFNIAQYVENSMGGFNKIGVKRGDSFVREKRRSSSSLARMNSARNQSSLLVIKKEIKEVLDKDKLRGMLSEFYEYPALYRQRIWISLLNLPIDRPQYLTVVQNTYPSIFDNIENEYPLENKTLLKNLKKILTNIVSWCPFFADVTFLPVFAFPFLKVFENDPVACFELVSTIIVNWCQHWFEYYPIPPINILAIIENIILEQDACLLAHLNKHEITAQLYAWPLLETAFSEVFSNEHWLSLWDHVLTNEPAFLLIAVVAYTLINRSTLIMLQRKEQFIAFYHTQNPIDFKKYIKKIYELLDSIGGVNHPRQYLDYFKKIDGAYPQFIEFPKACLEYRQNVKELEDANLLLLKQEQLIVKQGFEELDKLREIQKDGEQLLRIQELEKIYREKVKNEKANVEKQQEKLRNLRQQLQREEKEILCYAERCLVHKTCYDKQKALEMLLKNVEVQKHATNDCACYARNELMKHYETLLKHKMQIQKLLHNNNNQPSDDDLQVQQMKLIEEVKKAKKQVKSTEHMKQLNIATGIAAMDILITKVEAELNKESESDCSKDTSYKTNINKLSEESKELEKDVRKLLELLATF